MSNICTNIQQSEKLVRLGLDPATSDMWWIDDQLVAKSDKFDVPSNDEETTVHCAWSLSALLEVMPNNDYWEICLWQYKDQRWQCVFDDVEFSNGETKAFVADEPITAAYEMVCWLLENNLIEKGEKR